MSSIVRRVKFSGFLELLRSGSRCHIVATGTRMTSIGCQDRDRKVVPKDEVIRFIEECMCKAGTTLEDAHVVGHHLMIADYRGHFSHGMNRMQMYVKDIENRITDPAARPQIVTDFQVRTDLFFSLFLSLSVLLVEFEYHEKRSPVIHSSRACFETSYRIVFHILPSA